MSDRVLAVAGLHAAYVLIWAGLVCVAFGHGPVIRMGVTCWVVAAEGVAWVVLASLVGGVRRAVRIARGEG